MPIYEYRCGDCGHELEAMQRISADPLTDCPECGTDALKRLISQTSFVLKGSGWYATDYGGKKPNESSATEKGASGEATKSASSDATGSSDKPAPASSAA